MAFPKGKPNPNAGRPKGAINGATQDARMAIASFVNGNAERLVGWLDRIAEDDPKDAFNAFMSVVEYHIPKLARQELTGPGGEALTVQVLKLGDSLEELEKARLQLNLNSVKTINHQRDDDAHNDEKD